MQDLIKEIIEQSTGYKVLPEEIVLGSPVYQIIKKYCDGIIKRECEHAGYEGRIEFFFLIDDHIDGISLEVQGVRCVCLTTGTLDVIPWVIYKFGEEEDFFKEYNSDAPVETVIQELISYSVLLMILHELGHVFQGHIQYLSHGMETPQLMMSSKREHLCGKADNILAALEYAADVYAAEYISEIFLASCSSKQLLYSRVRNLYGAIVTLQMILAVFNKTEEIENPVLHTPERINEVFARALVETLEFHIPEADITEMIKNVYTAIAHGVYRLTKVKSQDLVNFQKNCDTDKMAVLEETWQKIRSDVLKFSIWGE